MTGAATVAAWVLALVLVAAAAGKLSRLPATRASFRAMRVPQAEVLSVAVPVVEIAVAVTLVARPAVGGGLSLVLLVAFTAVIVRALAGGVRAPCACFGTTATIPLGPRDVVRNGLLMALATVATAATKPHLPGLVTLVGIAGASIVVAALLRQWR